MGGLTVIVVATVIVSYFILKLLHPEVTPVVPMLVYVCLAYLVGKLYMNVFHLAVASILQCFLATEEMGGDDGFLPLELRTLDMVVQDMATPRGSGSAQE